MKVQTGSTRHETPCTWEEGEGKTRPRCVQSERRADDRGGGKTHRRRPRLLDERASPLQLWLAARWPLIYLWHANRGAELQDTRQDVRQDIIYSTSGFIKARRGKETRLFVTSFSFQANKYVSPIKPNIAGLTLHLTCSAPGFKWSDIATSIPKSSSVKLLVSGLDNQSASL